LSIPPVGLYNANNNLAIVDFPLPLFPTIAIVFPGESVNDTPLKTNLN
jgi:hypothetical protein